MCLDSAIRNEPHDGDNALAAVNIASLAGTTDLITDVEPNDTPAQATVLPKGRVHHVTAGQAKKVMQGEFWL